MMCFLRARAGQQLVDRLAQARQDVGAAAGGDARDVAQDALAVGGALQAHHRRAALSKTITAIWSAGGSASAVARAASLVRSILGPAIEPDLSMTSASASVASSRRSGMSSRTGSIDSRRVVM